VYWRREALAFKSGLLADLPDGLAAPRCYGVIEHPSGECWIWLEDLKDDVATEWTLDHYGVIARHLGRFNGAYLTGRLVPTSPWLGSRSWLRDSHARTAASRATTLAQLHNSLDHPLVRRAYPPDVVEILSREWAEGGKLDSTLLLDALDRLPQTPCHNDAIQNNLFTRYTPDGLLQIVAIDWELMGIGWIGQEMKKLVNHPITNITLDGAQARERDRIAFEGYLEGLRDAGWRGDPRQARFGQIAYEAIQPKPIHVPSLLDESVRAWLEPALGCSLEEWADRNAEQIRRPLFGYWEKEAWELFDALW
jgi:hypothetical protein